MSDFKAFLSTNAIQTENVKYVASKRFVDNGKPIEWEIAPISSEQDELLRKECTKQVPINGKRGQYRQETDTDKYITKLCAKCIVFPDLNAVELQDSYGVKSAEELLKNMLLPGEYTELKGKVMEVNGFDMSMEDLVDDAKN